MVRLLMRFRIPHPLTFWGTAASVSCASAALRFYNVPPTRMTCTNCVLTWSAI